LVGNWAEKNQTGARHLQVGRFPLEGRAWKAIRSGLDGKNDTCNVLVDAIAPAAFRVERPTKSGATRI
jgi:hypothetical protein